MVGFVDRFKARGHFSKTHTQALKDYEALKLAWARDETLNKYTYEDFAYQVMSVAMSDVCSQDMEIFEGTPFDYQLREIIEDIARQESLMHIIEIDPQKYTEPDELLTLRAYIKMKQKHLSDPMAMLSSAMNALATIIGRIFDNLPSGVINALTTNEPQDENMFEVAILDVIYRPKELISDVYGIFEGTGATKLEIFKDVSQDMVLRTYRASKMEAYINEHGEVVGERETAKKQLKLPFEYDGSPSETLKTFYGGSWVERLFKISIPFSIPENKRFEHTHILGKTGHGKTQLMQMLILKDLYKAVAGKASIVVIDSQADMIQKIARMKIFDPEFAQNVADRLIIIDPTDPQNPPALNLFDFSLAGHDASPREQERLLNSTIELYEYMFGALLGAEMTQKQGVIFKNLARLLTHVPNATVQTLMDFLEEGDTSINQYTNKLSGMPKRFFATQYHDPQFKETKKQILWRLHDIFGQAGFERMFVNEKNAIDMYGAINSGKIILINTATDYLGETASKIFGRFFIALLSQCVARRASIPESQRLPTYIYIDEASEYFDDKIRTLINKARKQKIALTMAHQELKQLTPELLNTIRTTGTKIVGKVTAPDARTMAEEMNCTKELLQGVRKVDYKYAEYTAYVSDLTESGIKMVVPFGTLEQEVKMSVQSLNELLERKRLELVGKSVRGDNSRGLPRPDTATNEPEQDFGDPELL